MAEKGAGRFKNLSMADPYKWSAQSISNIIAMPEYMGHTVNFKTCKVSYKTKAKEKSPRESWAVFENTQEAVIDKDTWELAQKLRKTNRRASQSESVPNRLTGLLYCADCGKKMSNDRSTDYKANKKRNNYLCSTYRHDTAACTIHYIRSDEVESAILDFFKKLSIYVKANEADFVRGLCETVSIRHAEATESAKQTLSDNQKRCSELDILIKKLYEDKVFGVITKKRFEILVGEYEGEQEKLGKDNISLEAGINKFSAENTNIEKFIGLVKSHTDFTELTTAALHKFVDKVIIRERGKRGRKKLSGAAHRIDIYFNFVGMINSSLN